MTHIVTRTMTQVSHIRLPDGARLAKGAGRASRFNRRFNRRFSRCFSRCFNLAGWPLLPLLTIVLLLAGPAAAQDRFLDPAQPLSAADGPVSHSTPDNGETGPPDIPAHQTIDEMAPVGSMDGAMDGAAIRQALEGEIARFEAEIAELRRLRGWQARLHDAAQTDPIGARRQRRDLSSCLTTPLAQWCPQLTGMYGGQMP